MESTKASVSVQPAKAPAPRGARRGCLPDKGGVGRFIVSLQSLNVALGITLSFGLFYMGVHQHFGGVSSDFVIGATLMAINCALLSTPQLGSLARAAFDRLVLTAIGALIAMALAYISTSAAFILPAVFVVVYTLYVAAIRAGRPLIMHTVLVIFILVLTAGITSPVPKWQSMLCRVLGAYAAILVMMLLSVVFRPASHWDAAFAKLHGAAAALQTVADAVWHVHVSGVPEHDIGSLVTSTDPSLAGVSEVKAFVACSKAESANHQQAAEQALGETFSTAFAVFQDFEGTSREAVFFVCGRPLMLPFGALYSPVRPFGKPGSHHSFPAGAATEVVRHVRACARILWSIDGSLRDCVSEAEFRALASSYPSGLMDSLRTHCLATMSDIIAAIPTRFEPTHSSDINRTNLEAYKASVHKLLAISKDAYSTHLQTAMPLTLDSDEDSLVSAGDVMVDVHGDEHNGSTHLSEQRSDASVPSQPGSRIVFPDTMAGHIARVRWHSFQRDACLLGRSMDDLMTAVQAMIKKLPS